MPERNFLGMKRTWRTPQSLKKQCNKVGKRALRDSGWTFLLWKKGDMYNANKYKSKRNVLPALCCFSNQSTF